MPKKGGLGQFADLGGDLARKKEVVFLRGVDALMHTMKARMLNIYCRLKTINSLKIKNFVLKHSVPIGIP